MATIISAATWLFAFFALAFLWQHRSVNGSLQSGAPATVLLEERNAESPKYQICTRKMLKMLQHLCNYCVDFWPQAEKRLVNKIKAAKIGENVLVIQSEVALVDSEASASREDLETFISSCCWRHQCSISSMKSYCCK